MRRLMHVFSILFISLLLVTLPSKDVSALITDNSARAGANVAVASTPDGFGYGVNFGNPSGWYNPGLASLAAAAGVNSARIKLPESHLARWGYDIEFTNGDMAAYQSNGLTNMTAFLVGPTADHSNSPTGGSLDQYSPKNLYQPIWSSPGVVNPNNYWAAYVHETVKRYKGYVKFWEVWNEPDQTSNWQATQSTWWTSPPSPKDLPWWNDSVFAYNRLLRVTYEVVKSVDPNGAVAVGGLGYESFLDAILRYTDNPVDGSVTPDYPARGGAWFDAVSYHHYPQYATYDQLSQTWLRGTDSDAMATAFVARKNTLRLQLEHWGYDGTTYPRKLWLATESGVSSKPINGLAGGPDLERNYLLKVPILAQANGVSQIDWFQLGDTEADSSASSPYAHMGLYYNLSGQTAATAQKKQSGVAFATYGAVLRGSHFDAAATAALSLPASARGYVFGLPDGRKTYVLWAATGNNSESASATVQLPTMVPLVRRWWDSSSTGATSTITPAGGSVSLALSATPLFLTETSASGGSPIPSPTPTTAPTVLPTASPTASPTAPATVPPTATPTAPPTPSPSPTQTVAPSSGGERLVNGDFESGLTGWYVPPWYASVVKADSGSAHAGSASLRFQGKTAGPYAYQDVPASPGEQLSLSGWINVPQQSGTQNVIVDLVARHQYNGDLTTTTVASITTTTNGWVRISGSATMPARTVSVRVRVRFPSLNGTVYVDSLSLQSGADSAPASIPVATATAPAAMPTPMPTTQPTAQPTATAVPTLAPAGQLLVNGDFEGGLASWYVPPWYANQTSVTSAVVHGGAKALQFSGKVSGPYGYQEVAALPGQQIDFSGWMNVTERYMDSAMVVELVAEATYNTVLATFPITTSVSATNGWVPISLSATMPARTAKVRLQIRFPKLHGTVYFDDLSLQVD